MAWLEGMSFKIDAEDIESMGLHVDGGLVSPSILCPVLRGQIDRSSRINNPGVQQFGSTGGPDRRENVPRKLRGYGLRELSSQCVHLSV